MTFVSAIRSGNADGVVAGVFSLCRHLFDAQPEAAAACRCSQVLGLAAGSCARGWKEAVSELPEHVSVSVALEKLIANSDKPEERISSLIAEYDTAHAKKETIAKTAAPLANVVAPTRAPDVASVTVGGHRAVMDNVVGAVAAVTKSGETTFATSTRADVENRINGVCSVLRDKGVVNKNLSGELIKAGILATSMYRLYTLLHQEGFGTADLTSQSNPSFKRNWKQINKPTLEACVTKLFAGILRLAA